MLLRHVPNLLQARGQPVAQLLSLYPGDVEDVRMYCKQNTTGLAHPLLIILLLLSGCGPHPAVQNDALQNEAMQKPQRLLAHVRKVMTADGIIALDNCVYNIWFARNYQAYQSDTVLLDNALASMGAGLPSAMAAHLVYPKRRVMAICGDGGFMMNSQELETAVRLKMNLIVLILRDDAYGMIKWKQAGMGFPDFGLDYGNPDFVKYAESYGAHGHRVEKTEDLLPLLERCHCDSGVHVIDCPVDYSDNDRILNREIKEKSMLV